MSAESAAARARAAKAKAKAPAIELHTVTPSDLVEVLRDGLRDFRAAPQYGLFFGAVYAAGGWVLLLLLTAFNLPYLAYPLAMGFALIAPFIATGFYDVSRRLEQGQPIDWSGVLGSVRGAGRRDLGWMALVTGFALVVWLDIAAVISFAFFGLGVLQPSELVNQIFGTGLGLAFLLVGNAVGALIAFAVFAISVVSFPLLFDRDIDFVTAMITSVRLVRKNPFSMALWCVLIAALVALSLLTAFAALVVVLPILGHATWHLYRRAVASAR